MPYVVFLVVLALSVGLSQLTGQDLGQSFLTLVGLVILAIGAAALYGIYLYVMSMREPIARWYYFTFHPHPAEPAIRAALSDGAALDGHQLANVLGNGADDGPILRAVRAEQAQSLITEMQAMTRQKLRKIEADTKDQYGKAAANQLQAALAQSAETLEQAKALLRAQQGISR